MLFTLRLSYRNLPKPNCRIDGYSGLAISHLGQVLVLPFWCTVVWQGHQMVEQSRRNRPTGNAENLNYTLRSLRLMKLSQLATLGALVNQHQATAPEYDGFV